MRIILICLLLVSCLSKTHHKHHQVPSINHVITPKGGQRRESLPSISDYMSLDIIDSKGQSHRENVNKAMYDDASFKQICLIKENEYFTFCQMLTDCAICAQTKYCGWCASSKQCLPGALNHAACPADCLQGWIFDSLNKKACMIKEGTGMYNSGRLDNVAPESSTLVKALVTGPKIRVRNIEKTMRPMKIKQAIGSLQEKIQTYYTDNEGKFNSIGEYTKKNIDKNVLVNVPIDEHVSETYYDADTNKILNPVQEKVTHAKEEKRY